jgi:hypothetical protein
MKAALALVSAVFCLQGCVYAPPPGPPSPSQQLLDLKKAIEAGVITEQEYNRRVREILHKTPVPPSGPTATG